MVTIFDILKHLCVMEERSKYNNPRKLKAYMKDKRFMFINSIKYRIDILMMFKCYDEIPALNEGKFTSRSVLHQQIRNAITEIMTDPQGLINDNRTIN